MEYASYFLKSKKTEPVTLKVGDRFQQAWRGNPKPMWFKVTGLDRENNTLEVECHTIDGYSFKEEWDDLHTTEIAFEIGEYSLI